MSRTIPLEIKEIDDEESLPYDNITDRPTLEPLPNAKVKEHIAKRMALATNLDPSQPIEASSSPMTDPLLEAFEQEQSQLEEYRKAKAGADHVANLGQAFSNLAMGASDPKEQSSLYRGIAQQNKDILQSKEQDASRRRMVMDAIENRKSREAMSKDNRQSREDQARQHSEDNKLRYAQIQAEKGLKNRDIERLPEEDREVVKDLSKKNASKIGIANQIDAVMGNWSNLSDDQKVAQGRQLLKTLNSTEGADAVGTEEAKRLGSKLEFAMGNLFNSNPIQFGRDLEGFEKQARDTSASIRKAVSSNESEISGRYGKVGIEKNFVKPKEIQTVKNKPKTVVQNGHTYTLNEETGQYE